MCDCNQKIRTIRVGTVPVVVITLRRNGQCQPCQCGKEPEPIKVSEKAVTSESILEGLRGCDTGLFHGGTDLRRGYTKIRCGKR